MAHALGAAAHWIGAALLIATGGYAVLQAIRSQARDLHQPAAEGNRPGIRAAAGHRGSALSIDNLAVGFALGAYHVNLAAAAVLIGAVSVTLSWPGWSWGPARRQGRRAGRAARRPGPHRRRDSHCQRHPLAASLALPHD